MCSNCRGHPTRTLVVQRWRRGSAKKSWTHLWNASGVGGIMPSQRRNQGRAPLAPPGQTPRQNIRDRMHGTYDHYKDIKEGSCKEALAIMWDTHWWALVATALLDEKIERPHHSLSHSYQCSRRCKHSGSYCQRSWAGSCQDRAPQEEACQGGSSKRWAQSPSPRQLRGACHFWGWPWRGHQSWGAPSAYLGRHGRDQSRRGWPVGPASPWPTPEGVPSQSRRVDNSQLTLLPELSFNNSSEWVRWHAEQLETPIWWQELSKVPIQTDVQEFVWQIQALFQLFKVSSHAQGVDNNFWCCQSLSP